MGIPDTNSRRFTSLYERVHGTCRQLTFNSHPNGDFLTKNSGPLVEHRHQQHLTPNERPETFYSPVPPVSAIMSPKQRDGGWRAQAHPAATYDLLLESAANYLTGRAFSGRLTEGES